MVDLARKNLLHDKLRFAITVSGVAFAVTLVLVQVGLFLGLLDNASVTIDKLPAHLWVTSKNTANIDFPHGFPDSYVQRVRSIDGVKQADNLVLAYMEVALPTGAQESTLVYALEDFARWGFPWKVTEGDVEDLRRGPYVFIDQAAEQRFGPFAVGEHREYMGTRLEIIGRSEEAKSFTTTPLSFMDLHLARSLIPSLRGRTNYVLVELADGADLEAVRAEIARRLPHNDVFTAAEWATKSKMYWIVSTGLGFNMFITVFLGLLVGVVVVAQTLYTSTMEHLREFGTVKAIGGANRIIYAILGKQALIAAFVGFAVGALLSLGSAPLVTEVGLKLTLPGELVLVTFVGTTLMCLGAAALSFRKIASIDPALVFRT